MTTPVLYAHPFSSYSQKAFIAFYEKEVPFELRSLSPDNPSAVLSFGHSGRWRSSPS